MFVLRLVGSVILLLAALSLIHGQARMSTAFTTALAITYRRIRVRKLVRRLNRQELRQSAGRHRTEHIPLFARRRQTAPDIA